MSSSAKASAGAMGSKAARACDGCLRRRARWYCAADDAFLCQACDTSVHSANPLARRHERVRLRPTSPQPQPGAGPRARRGDEVVPAWFKRKPRTPRGKSVVNGHHLLSSRRPVVPDEASGGESSPEEHKLFEGETDEEELLYSVPVFDPALAEFCSQSSPRHLEADASCCNEGSVVLESPTEPAAAAAPSPAVDQFFPDDSAVNNFGPTDAELMEFAADMEALLGRGLDEGNEEEPFCMEALGLVQPMDVDGAGGRVKMETEGQARGMFLACVLEREPEPELSGNMLGIDFDDYGSPQATPDESAPSRSARFLPRSLSLNLNYEAIIDNWEKSPWADGERPDVKLDDCWPHDYSMSVWMMGGVLVGNGTDELRTPRMKMDGGRDARVSRYREKRRTRLFSKKIRYEVRKLNAEKRPRMKGRFVKRANGVAVATACVA